MIGNSVTYNEQVNVFSESGETLGTDRLVGTARRNSRSGRWSWSGQLHDTSFEPGILLDSGQLRLEFNDGAVGYALCRNIAYSTRRTTRVELVGTGRPPRLEAG